MKFKTFSINKKGLIFQSLEILENGELKYLAKRSGVFKPSFVISDLAGIQQLKISKLITFFKMQFEIFKGDSKIAHIDKENKILKQSLQVNTKSGVLDIHGNFRRNSYTISRRNEEIAKISCNGFKRNNYIGIAIKAVEDYLLILGIVLALELKIQVQNASG